MEHKGTCLGRSLLVPSVLELVKEPLIKVPPRYVRNDQDPLVVSSLCEVPTIDMQQLTSDDSADYELERLHLACKDWGFFQIINHGVSCTLVDKVKKETQEFLKLPLEEKKKFWQTVEDVQGFGQLFVVSEEQKLDWADMFYLVTLPHHLRKPHLFPNLPLPFRETLEAYSRELKSLALKLLLYIAKALKMDTKDIVLLFEDGMQGMRMNYYPPCPQPEQVMGLTAHSDASGIIILLELNEIEGLQINKENTWIPVKSQANAFVVNIGDALEIVTNGQYKSIEHRAVVNSQKERFSVATFLSPNLDGDIGPASSLITHETPAKFKRVNVLDYFQNLFSNKLNSKSNVKQYNI